MFDHRLVGGAAGQLLFVFNVCDTFDGPCRLGAVRQYGRVWSTPETLTLYNVDGTGDAFVRVGGAIDRAGMAIALWSQESLYFDSPCPGPAHTSFALARRAPVGSGLGAVESAVRPFTGAAMLHDVAAADDGTIVSLLGAWRFDSRPTCRQDAAGEVWAMASEAGSSWTSESLFAGGVLPGSLPSVVPALAPAPDGAWAAALVAPRTRATQLADVDWFLEVRRFRTGRGWSPAERIAYHRDLTYTSSRFVGIVADAEERALVVWQFERTLWSAAFDARTGWQAPQPLVQLTDPVANVAMAGNPAGDVLVAWSAPGGAGGREDVYATRSRIGGGWSTRVMLNTDAAGRATGGVARGLGSPMPPLDVAIDGQGRTIAVWGEVNASTPLGALWSNQGMASGWSGARPLPADGTQPHVRFDGQGQAVAVWARDDLLVSSRID